MKREATEGHHLVGNNALRRTGHLKKTLQRINFGFQSSHFFFGSLSSASILCFEELTQFLYIVMLILETDLPWSHVQQEFGIQTTSIQCLDIFRQPWLKTLPARVSYLSSYISTSEKFLISMAHQDLLLHAPCWTSGSICKYLQRTCEHRQHVKWILMCNCLQVVRDVITPPHPPVAPQRDLQRTCEHGQHVKCWNKGTQQLHGKPHVAQGVDPTNNNVTNN